MKFALAAAMLAIGTGAALAQTSGQSSGSVSSHLPSVPAPQTPAATVNPSAQTNTSPSPSAVQTNNTTSRTSAAPVPGRNSFTEREAQRRIAAAGFADVKSLKKDEQGIWRGQATKDGAPVSVALDYQGNVVGK